MAAPKLIQAPVPFAALDAKPFEARALRSAIGDALVLAREHRAAGLIRGCAAALAKAPRS